VNKRSIKKLILGLLLVLIFLVWFAIALALFQIYAKFFGPGIAVVVFIIGIILYQYYDPLDDNLTPQDYYDMQNWYDQYKKSSSNSK
jgi:peptidoglycan biosynthesis protein MviN/MurJ (putative lipid II flippase)